MSGCVIRANAALCGSPGREYMIGCVHEHAGVREICDEHAEGMRNNTWCIQCLKGVYPHECMVSLHVIFPGMVTRMAGS